MIVRITSTPPTNHDWIRRVSELLGKPVVVKDEAGGRLLEIIEGTQEDIGQLEWANIHVTVVEEIKPS